MDLAPASRTLSPAAGASIHLGWPLRSEFSFPAVNSSSCLRGGIPSFLVREAAVLLRKRKGYVVEAALLSGSIRVCAFSQIYT